MDNRAGAIESLAIQLASFLRPLSERLSDPEIIDVFAELGMLFPAALLSNATFAGQLATTRAGTQSLPNLIKALRTVVDEGDLTGAVAALSDLGSAVELATNGLSDLATALNTAAKALPDFSAAEVDAFTNGLGPRLFQWSAVTFIEDGSPPLAALLDLLDVIERSEQQVGSGDPKHPQYTRRRLDLSRLPGAIFSPFERLKDLYGFGNAGFDGASLFARLERIVWHLGLPALNEPSAVPPQLDLVFADLRVKGDVSPPGLAFDLKTRFNQTFAVEGDPVSLSASVRLAGPVGTTLGFQPDLSMSLTAPAAASVSGELSLHAQVSPQGAEDAVVLLGRPGESRLEVGGVALQAGTALTWRNNHAEGAAKFNLDFERIRLVIKPSDSFLSSVFQDAVDAAFDFGMSVTPSGLQFTGAGKLFTTLYVHVHLGPLKVESVTLGLDVDGSALDIETSTTLKLEIGPAILSFERLGIESKLRFQDGNLGPVDASLGFKFPTGIALSVDMPPVKGGGFLRRDPAAGEYAGIVQLAVAETFDIKATGLVTKLPSGDFSVLAIGSVEFLPPIQLFAGFGLGGVGLLVGIHRAMNGDALRAGVREGSLDAILFPKDPIKNATRIVNSLAKFFPATQDTYVFGGMGLVVWGAGGFFEVKLGIALEVPHHIKLLVAAILNISLSPQRGEVLRLRQDVLGFWDSGTGELTIDGYLFDSVVAGFVVSGSSHFRNKSSQGFILSVGGFHPAFTPPGDLTDTDRVSIAMSAGPFKMRVEGYFAITSNTLQAGARAELRAGSGKFGLEGWMGVDMLIQYDPFRVIVDFSAGVAIKVGGSKIMSLTLNARLDGFTPTKINGKVSFKILFVRIKIPVSLTFGKSSKRSFAKADVLKALKAELQQQRNWATDLDKVDGQGVTLRQPLPIADAGLLVHPLAPLSVRQQVVPLSTEIELFKSAKPVDQKEFYIQQVIIGPFPGTDPVDPSQVAALSDDFAPAQYFEFTDDEKLSTPSFEKMDGGVRITTSEIEFGHDSDLTGREMHYETEILDREEDEWRKREEAQRRYLMFVSVLIALSVLSKLAQRQRELNPSQFYPRGQKVKLKPQQYVVAQRVNGALQIAASITPEPTSHTRATGALRRFKHDPDHVVAVARDPNRYRVVGAHEI